MLTYTDSWNQYLRNIGKASMTTADSNYTNIQNDFNNNMQSRYSLIMANLTDYMTQTPKTASTVASQQFYHYPPGVVNVEDVVIDYGSFKQPLDVIVSQKNWDILNSIPIQPSATAQFYFPRRDDFGIWPTPQGVYTITFNQHIRDRAPTIADYTTGNIAVTAGSTTVTGTTTNWTNTYASCWLSVTDTTSTGWGYWYRISSVTNTTTLVLENNWQGSTGSGYTYRIGQAPEIPEEGHQILVDGVTSDYYAGIRDATDKATWWENKFWTGSGIMPPPPSTNAQIRSGLIGLINRYSDRNKEVLINRNPRLSPAGIKVWAYSIS